MYMKVSRPLAVRAGELAPILVLTCYGRVRIDIVNYILGKRYVLGAPGMDNTPLSRTLDKQASTIMD